MMSAFYDVQFFQSTKNLRLNRRNIRLNLKAVIVRSDVSDFQRNPHITLLSRHNLLKRLHMNSTMECRQQTVCMVCFINDTAIQSIKSFREMKGCLPLAESGSLSIRLIKLDVSEGDFKTVEYE